MLNILRNMFNELPNIKYMDYSNKIYFDMFDIGENI